MLLHVAVIVGLLGTGPAQIKHFIKTLPEAAADPVGDPPGTCRAFTAYYNTLSNKNRCCENNAWTNCHGGGIGGVIPGGTPNSVLFIDGAGNMAQDNPGIVYAPVAVGSGYEYLGIGPDASPAAPHLGAVLEVSRTQNAPTALAIVNNDAVGASSASLLGMQAGSHYSRLYLTGDSSSWNWPPVTAGDTFWTTSSNISLNPGSGIFRIINPTMTAATFYFNAGSVALGIGTETPQNTVDIEGGLAVGATYSGTNSAPVNGMLVEGSFGLGTTTPASKLDIEGGLAVGATYSGTSAAPANGAIIEGSLGVGTNAPAAAFSVFNLFQVDSSGRTFLPAGATGSGNLALSFVGDPDTGIYNTPNTMLFQTGGTDRVSINTTDITTTIQMIWDGVATDAATGANQAWTLTTGGATGAGATGNIVLNAGNDVAGAVALNVSAGVGVGESGLLFRVNDEATNVMGITNNSAVDGEFAPAIRGFSGEVVTNNAIILAGNITAGQDTGTEGVVRIGGSRGTGLTASTAVLVNRPALRVSNYTANLMDFGPTTVKSLVGFDAQANIVNSTSLGCGVGVSNGSVCVNDPLGAYADGGGTGAFILGAKNTNTTAGAGTIVGVFAADTDTYAQVRLVTSGLVQAGGIIYTGSTYSVVGARNDVAVNALLADLGLNGKTGVQIYTSDDIADGSPAVTFGDNTVVDNLATISGGGRFSPLLYGSLTNCADSAGAAACAAAPAGAVVIDAAATTVVVSTTAVTANSRIILTEDPSLATELAITCNTTTGRTYTVTARTAATSFTITASAAPVTDPACLSYWIIN